LFGLNIALISLLIEIFYRKYSCELWKIKWFSNQIRFCIVFLQFCCSIIINLLSSLKSVKIFS
jgi:hypothetical protein